VISPENHLSARLSVLEFALGVEISNRLAMATPDYSRAYKEDMIRVFKSQIFSDKVLGGSEQAEAEIVECLKLSVDMFIRDVSDHEALIRAEREAKGE